MILCHFQSENYHLDCTTILLKYPAALYDKLSYFGIGLKIGNVTNLYSSEAILKIPSILAPMHYHQTIPCEADKHCSDKHSSIPRIKWIKLFPSVLSMVNKMAFINLVMRKAPNFLFINLMYLHKFLCKDLT